MPESVHDVNIESTVPLMTPDDLIAGLSVTAKASKTVVKGRSLISMTVHDGSNTDLDGHCGPNTAPNIAFPIGTPGSSGGEPIYYVSKFKLAHLLGGGAKPEDIAGAVAYLLDAPFVTGATLVVDGGMTRKMIYEE